MFILELYINCSLTHVKNVLNITGNVYKVISKDEDRFIAKKIKGVADDDLDKEKIYFYKKNINTIINGCMGYHLIMPINADSVQEIDSQKTKEQWIQIFRDFINKERAAIDNRLEEILNNNSGMINT